MKILLAVLFAAGLILPTAAFTTAPQVPGQKTVQVTKSGGHHHHHHGHHHGHHHKKA